MIQISCLMVLITTVYCQQAAPGVVEDLLNIFYNGAVALQNCSNFQKVSLSNIKYTLYTQENQQNGISLNNTNLNAVNSNLDVIFIIHGWLQNGNQGWVIQMKNTYLDSTACNIIVVDWSYYAGNINYGEGFCAVPQVGVFTGDLIYNLTVDAKINLNKTEINGFSLGGHVAGYAGQEIQNKSGGSKIIRINGLDVAGPGYMDLPMNQRLDASDAVFVQGIHTSSWQFGYPYNYATVDFYVNYAFLLGCGVIQRGCPLNPGVPKTNDLSSLLPYVFCNHVRAAVYFIESINSTNFIGAKCTNCNKFGTGSCWSNPRTVMGEKCPFTARGQMILNTNPTSHFAQGNEGIPRPILA